MIQPCILSGELIEYADAKIRADDIGLLRGFGAFEYMRTYYKKPFMLEEHLDRLENTARAMGLTLPYSRHEYRDQIQQVIDLSPHDEVGIKIIVTGGKTLRGIEFESENAMSMVFSEPCVDLPRELYDKGAKLISHEHQRTLHAAKTTNYLQSALLQDKRKAAGAVEILYHHNGFILECSMANFFIVSNGTLITAKDNMLHGITRMAVLQMAQHLQIPVEVRDVEWKELSTADEAFLTGSNKEIMPIVQVDELQIGNATVGDTTQRLMALFREWTWG